MGRPSPECRSRLTFDRSPVRESVRREKRRVESLPQAGEAGRDASGSTVLPYGESLWGQEHDGEAGVRANMPDPMPRKARAIWLRMDCLNPSHRRWKRTFRATACRGAVGGIGRFHFRRPTRRAAPAKSPPAERRPARSFKGTNRGPTSRYHVRLARTRDRLRAARPMATERS